jgi:hypothetical protein
MTIGLARGPLKHNGELRSKRKYMCVLRCAA